MGYVDTTTRLILDGGQELGNVDMHSHGVYRVVQSKVLLVIELSLDEQEENCA